LVLPVFGAGDLQRGTHVQLRLSDIDDITLDISGHLLHVLEVDAPSSAEQADMVDDEDDSPAGPISLAMDVNEAQAPEVNAA
jgi:exoribonuclease-2